MSLFIDMPNILKGEYRDNFTSLLLRLIFKADRSNREKLRKGFPDEVRIVEHYRETGEILGYMERNNE